VGSGSPVPVEAGGVEVVVGVGVVVVGAGVVVVVTTTGHQSELPVLWAWEAGWDGFAVWAWVVAVVVPPETDQSHSPRTCRAGTWCV